MTYIENVFVCIAAPLFITMLCVGRRYHAAFALCFAGMFVCLLSAYLNTFFTLYYQADTMNATTQIAPVVEEIMNRSCSVSDWQPCWSQPASRPLRISVISPKTAQGRFCSC